MFRGSFDKALWPQAFGLRALKLAVCLHGNGPLLLGRSSLAFARPQTRKMFRGSFDQALWPQAFGLRALKPAFGHGPLLLRRSSLPFARPQTRKMFRGSFDQALWPQALRPQAFGVRALQPAVCVHGLCRLPAFQPLKCPAAASTRHSGHKHLVLEP